MGVQLYKSYGAELFVDCPQNRQQDGMVSANANWVRSGTEHFPELLSDPAIRIFDRERVYGEVAKIGDPPLFKWIDLQHWIPWTNHG